MVETDDQCDVISTSMKVNVFVFIISQVTAVSDKANKANWDLHETHKMSFQLQHCYNFTLDFLIDALWKPDVQNQFRHSREERVLVQVPEVTVEHLHLI